MSKHKKTISSGVLKKLVHDIGKEKSKFFLAWVIVILSKICLAIAPKLGGRITDKISEFAITGSIQIDLILKMCILFSILYFIGYAADTLVGVIMLGVSKNMVRLLRDKSQVKMNHLPIRYLDNHPTGDLLSRLTTDMSTLSSCLESTLSNLLAQVVLLIGVIVMMLITDVRLSLIYLFVLPLGSLVCAKIIFYTKRLLKRRSIFTGRLSSQVSDTFSAQSIVKAYGCEENVLKNFDGLMADYHKANVNAQFANGFILPISNMVNNLGYIILCVVSGILLIRGKLTIGEFQSFLVYGNMLLTPLIAITADINTLQDGVAAAERIYEFLDEKEEVEAEKEEIDYTSIKGTIGFEHVKFSYVPEKELMKDVNLQTKPGMTIAVVGPTGAGKTTLINLLMRFYEISGGKITLDGKNIADLTRDSLRKCFGIVLQDSWIFDGTIAENIAYGKPDATMEEIKEVAKMINCDSFIEKLPEGYETRISEESAALSSGEKQLLAIARTVLLDPQILILDEATSQVDTRTEFVITQAMEKLMSSRTCFVIAHRLFTIKNADMILYMENGDIKEVGNHEELMEKDGAYAKLYLAAADKTGDTKEMRQMNAKTVLIELSGRIDSMNANRLGEEWNQYISQNAGEEIVFDAEKLDYISSAGLRELLKLAKAGKKLHMINAKDTVKEIFTLTGFNEILGITFEDFTRDESKFREISVEGCEAIGSGSHCTVYRLDEETIVKLYNPDILLSDIKLEQERARRALVKGIPTAITYDIVRCGNQYGLVFEMINAVTMAKYVTEHPEKLEEYAEKFANLSKKMHSIHMKPNEMDSMKEMYHKRANDRAVTFTPEEVQMLHRMIDAIPDGDVIIHGDFHPSNVMVQDEELILIDMADVNYGNEIYDIGGSYMSLIYLPKTMPNQTAQIVRLSYEETKVIWDRLLKVHYGENVDMDAMNRCCEAFTLLRICTAKVVQSEKEESRSKYVCELARKDLFPRVDEICEAFSKLKQRNR